MDWIKIYAKLNKKINIYVKMKQKLYFYSRGPLDVIQKLKK